MPGESTNKRSDRVRRLKKLILILLFAALILPMICSVLMLVKLRQMNEELAVMTEEVNRLKERESSSAQISERVYEEAAVAAESQDMTQPDAPMPEGQDAGEGNAGQEKTCKVYLTFDDGPSSNTAAILDLLKQYGVKGTFFVTGKEGEQYEALYRRIVDEGHTLGMHSYSHKYREIYASKEAFVTDLEKLQDYLYVTTGVWPRFYRFPGGSSNQVSRVDMQQLVDYLGEQDIYYLDWNIVSGDAASGIHSAKALSDRVLRYIGAEETEVVLMHDAAEKSTTVDALAIILEEITKRDDVEILPVSEDMDFEAVRHLKNGGE